MRLKDPSRWKVCLQCGNPFYHRDSAKPGKFCCKTCYDLSRKSQITREQKLVYGRKYYQDHREDFKTKGRDYRHRTGFCKSMSENKECSAYLGIHIAERVLSNYFDNVVRMPMGNKGYDYVCSKGKRIDVKCGCRLKQKHGSYHWVFRIRRNLIADYFLCLAFDNREDLNPLHVWLIPGNVISHLTNLSINDSETVIRKWAEHERSLKKVVACCKKLRCVKLEGDEI